jgi:hypothetical protein
MTLMLVQGGGHPWQIWDHFACQEGGVVFGKEFYDEGVPKHFKGVPHYVS